LTIAWLALTQKVRIAILAATRVQTICQFLLTSLFQNNPVRDSVEIVVQDNLDTGAVANEPTKTEPGNLNDLCGSLRLCVKPNFSSDRH
jgi:hypothetical protein